MASSEIYFKEVVVVTTIPTNKANLGEIILKDIEKKTFPKDTTFFVVCGFHTKVRSDLLTLCFFFKFVSWAVCSNSYPPTY